MLRPPAAPKVVHGIPQVVVAASGALAVAVWLLLAVPHLTDRRHVDHVAGAWLALVGAAGRGELYPPLFDDGYYGGTRYAPLGIAAYWAATVLPGDDVASGKALSLALLLGLLAGVYVLVRRAGAGRALAVGAVGAVVASFPVSYAGSTVYGDLLPVVLQVAGVAAVARTTSRRRATAAGVLTALAVTAKLSAVWGGATVLVWLLVKDRRSVPAFVLVATATAAAVLTAAAVVSEGRMQENLLGLTTAGLVGGGPGTLRRLLETILDQATTTAVLLPLAAVAVLAAARRRSLDVWHVALVLSGVVTFVVFSDVGAGFNHLLDLAVLVPVVVAAALARWRPTNALWVAALLLPIAIGPSLYDVRQDVRQTAAGVLDGRREARLEADVLGSRLGASFMSEDPLVAVDRGVRPVVQDSFMLLRIAREHPDWEAALVRRLDAREFDTVVLITDLDPTRGWYRESHLGVTIARAIDRNYRLTGTVQGPVFTYRLLEPRA